MEGTEFMEIARHWRMNKQRYTLTGSICECCGQASFNIRPICSECLSKEQPAQPAQAHSQPDQITLSIR
jgi:uncharacterized OB-fold protein